MKVYEKRINFHKNKLLNDTLDKYYDTFSHTLDTADYVPEKFNKKIYKYIFKDMKKSFKKINKDDKLFQKVFKEQVKVKIKAKKKLLKANKPKLITRVKQLFKRKKEDTIISSNNNQPN